MQISYTYIHICIYTYRETNVLCLQEEKRIAMGEVKRVYNTYSSENVVLRLVTFCPPVDRWQLLSHFVLQLIDVTCRAERSPILCFSLCSHLDNELEDDGHAARAISIDYIHILIYTYT